MIDQTLCPQSKRPVGRPFSFAFLIRVLLKMITVTCTDNTERLMKKSVSTFIRVKKVPIVQRNKGEAGNQLTDLIQLIKHKIPPYHFDV